MINTFITLSVKALFLVRNMHYFRKLSDNNYSPKQYIKLLYGQNFTTEGKFNGKL